MPHLDTKTTKVNGFVHFKGLNFFEMPLLGIQDYFNENCVRWGFCVHDEDLANDGDCVNPHIQFVFDLKKQKRLITVVNDIARVCDVDPLAVTVDRYTSFIASYQYLIHRNRPQKHQYEVERLITNLPDDERDLMVKSNYFVLDFDNLFELVSNASTETEIIAVIGIGYYRHYRQIIQDIYHETHNECGGKSPVMVDIVKERVAASKLKYILNK